LAWALLRCLPLDGVSVFDRLQLRRALATTFHGLGLSGEDGWRAAARVRFLLHRANPMELDLSRTEWHDPDVRWLTGTHDAEGVRYFNQESHQELLWWIQVPALVAARPQEQRAAAQSSFSAVSRAIDLAKAAGFRLDDLLSAESRVAPAGVSRTVQKTSKASKAPSAKKKPNESAARPSEAKKTRPTTRKKSTVKPKPDKLK
jgi:hypothetical protein